MKSNRFLLVLYVIVAFVLISVSVAFGIEQFTKWVGIGLGACITLLALVVHLIGNDITFTHLISFVMNSIAVGFSISSFYIYIEKTVELTDYLTASFIGITAVIAYLILTAPKAVKDYRKSYGLFFIGITFVFASTVWIQNHQPLYSLLFFYMIILNFYVGFSLFANDSLTEFLKYMSIGSFGSYIIVSIIVLVIITEGQALEGFDGFGGFGSGKKKNQGNM